MAVPRTSTAARFTTVLAEPPEYVEFYLGNMYAWKERGVARVLEYLASWNVDCAYYLFEPDLGWFVVRCLRSDAKYIQTKFVGLQNDIEREVRSLKSSNAMEAPAEIFDHPDVEMPTHLPSALEMSSTEVVSDASSSTGNSNSRNISLVVPSSLQEYPLVVAWQDLQQRNKTFDPDFITQAAQKRIEQVHNVALVADQGQKVIFIGGSDAAALRLVKVKLSTLLQDSLSSEQPIRYLRHIFFVSQPVHGDWKVEVRKIMDINPRIRRSTILDPWHFDGCYDCLTQASCLRICMEDPLRKGPRNTLWSLRGPFPKSVLETQKPRYSSEVFKNLTVAKRHRISRRPDINENEVANWLEEVSELRSALPDVNGTSSDPEVASEEVLHPMSELGEDDPVPMGQADRFDDDEPVALNFQQFARRSSQNSPNNRALYHTTGSQNATILDRDDPVLRNPRSALQRPMLPPKRIIKVPHPDTLPCNDFQFAVLHRGLELGQGEELDRLVVSIQNLMRPMPVRYGLVKLRAELGRFFASKVPKSGLAKNSPNTPADGWVPEKLRGELTTNQAAFFSKALSCYGNDVDLLVKMKIQGTNSAMWKPYSRNVFLDFRFRVLQGGVMVQGAENAGDLVLEINTEDYSWIIRGWDNACGSINVHCLRQHWDFRVRLSHDHSLEYNEQWGQFAQALIDSLEVSPPKLEFQYFFGNDNKELPIVVNDVRVRQVCRFQHHNEKVYLDISRISPTKPTNSGSHIANCTERATFTRDKAETGEFTNWYEAAISSVRLEEVLKENATLVPGDTAGWNVEHLAQEVRDVCVQAASMVQQMDPVGIGCDNGLNEQYWHPTATKHAKDYKF